MSSNYLTPEERRVRILTILLIFATVIIAVFSIIHFSGKERKGPKINPVPPETVETIATTPSRDTVSVAVSEYQVIDEIFKTPLIIDVRRGERYEDAVANCYPEIADLSYYGIGGCKLLGEIIADAHGIDKSVSPVQVTYRDVNISHYGIGVDRTPNGVFRCLYRGDIIVESDAVRSDPDGLYVYVVIENKRNRNIDICIRRGTMLEVNGDDVQNLVVRSTVKIKLHASERRTVRLFALCASQDRALPSGYTVSFTPFYLLASESAYQSTSTIWEWQSKIYSRIK